MPSRVVPSPTPGSRAAQGRGVVAAVLLGGVLAGPAVPGAVAAPAPATSSVLLAPRDYPPPPSWTGRKAICSPISLGGGRARHGLPASEYTTKVTSLRVTAKRRVSCAKARTSVRRYFVKGVKSGYTWRSTKSWGRDDGKGADEYQGTRKGGLRVVFIGSN